MDGHLERKNSLKKMTRKSFQLSKGGSISKSASRLLGKTIGKDVKKTIESGFTAVNLMKVTTESQLNVYNLFKYLMSIGELCTATSYNFEACLPSTPDITVATYMRDWLTHAHTLRNNNTWITVFYTYMKDGSIVRKNLLTDELMTSYCAVFSSYLETSANEQIESIKEAAMINQFLSNYKLDPYSCLIGLRLSKEVQNASLSLSDKELNTICDAPVRPKKGLLLNYDNHFYHKDTYIKLIEWAKMDNGEQVIEEIRKYLSFVRGSAAIKDGELVGLVTDQPIGTSNNDTKVIFARVKGRSNEFVNVCTHPTRSEIISVPLNNIFPLSLETKESIKNAATVQQLEKFVAFKDDEIIREIMALCKRRCKEYLDKAGIALEVIEMARSSECSLQELDALNHAQSFLSKLDSWPKEFCDKLQEEVKPLLDDSLSEYEEEVVFWPTKEDRKKKTKQFDYSQVLQMELVQVKGQIASALDQLQLQKRVLMNGTRKNLLVDWWLHFIEERVNSLLSPMGYDLKAISDDYTNKPPEDIVQIRHNLVILQRVLRSFREGTDNSLRNLIKELQNLIYARIDAFLTDVNITLSELFMVEIDAINNVTQAKSLLTTYEGVIDDESKTWVSNMIKDVEYLAEMKRMEDPAYKGNSFHIVPISGLVVGRICCMENECKTVLNLWVPSCYVSQDDRKKKQLHHAAEAGDALTVECLLPCGNEINAQDSHGWTPLHYASTSVTRLKVCKLLLNTEEISVGIKNEEGDLALHYLVRLPIESTSTLNEYHEILKMMIRKAPLSSNAKNKKGETPLHCACLSRKKVKSSKKAINTNTGAVVLALLQAKASPYSAAIDGETPLHYAVRGADEPLVTCLVEYKADPAFEDKNGRTPLDLAIANNDTKMAQYLSEIICKQRTGQRSNESANIRKRSASKFLASQRSGDISSPKKRTASVDNSARSNSPRKQGASSPRKVSTRASRNTAASAIEASQSQNAPLPPKRKPISANANTSINNNSNSASAPPLSPLPPLAPLPPAIPTRSTSKATIFGSTTNDNNGDDDDDVPPPVPVRKPAQQSSADMLQNQLQQKLMARKKLLLEQT